MAPAPILQVFTSANLLIGIALFANYSTVSVEASDAGESPSRPREKLHLTVSTVCLSDSGVLRYDSLDRLVKDAIKAYYQLTNDIPF